MALSLEPFTVTCMSMHPSPEWAVLRPSYFMQNFTDPGHGHGNYLRLIGHLHFIDFLERLDMLHLLVLVLGMENPIHEPIAEQEKNHLIDAIIDD